MHEIINVLAEYWASGWLWIYGGSFGPEIWMLLSSAILGSVLIALPLLIALNTMEKIRKAELLGVPDNVSRFRYVMAWLSIPLLFVSLFLTVGVGILGNQSYADNFRVCYQVATPIESTDYDVIYETKCATRTHVDDEWNEWVTAGASLQPSLYLELVDELPELN